MVEIVHHFIPKTNKRTRPGITRVPRSITIHETDNENVGANALAHARLQYNGNKRQASWHIQVDDQRKVYVSIPFDEVAYAAGDKHGPGNMYSIHIEMCVNKDGNYLKTVGHTIEVVRYLLKMYPSIEEIVPHYKWSGKNCPKYLLSGSRGMNWETFIKKIYNNHRDASLNPSLKTKQTNEQLFSIGELVRIKASARTYATGEIIPDFVKGKPDTVLQLGKNRILLQKINSWLLLEDVEKMNKEEKVGQIKENGYLTVETIEALQRYFKTPVDGKISEPSLLIRAMQAWLNTPVDGVISKPYSKMVAALQKRYGTPVDGYISKPSMVIKELQKRLNEGKL